MDSQQIKVFIDAMASSGLAEMEASKDGWNLRLVREVRDVPGRHASVAAGAAPAAIGIDEQCAALSGVVFLHPAPGAPPFVLPGQTVKAGQTLCVIEAMKIFNEVQAERDGIVERFLVASGQEVDAGQPLLRLC